MQPSGTLLRIHTAATCEPEQKNRERQRPEKEKERHRRRCAPLLVVGGEEDHPQQPQSSQVEEATEEDRGENLGLPVLDLHESEPAPGSRCEVSRNDQPVEPGCEVHFEYLWHRERQALGVGEDLEARRRQAGYQEDDRDRRQQERYSRGRDSADHISQRYEAEDDDEDRRRDQQFQERPEAPDGRHWSARNAHAAGRLLLTRCVA